MEFEVNMDDDFESEILKMLGLVELSSPSVARCELRRIAASNKWIIECLWSDQRSMYSHFGSSQLQELIKLLVSRSGKILFECGNV